MRLPWLPIPVEAVLEPDGFRVIGDNGGAVLPAGSFVPWPRVSGDMSCYKLPLDDEGRPLEYRNKMLCLSIDFKAAELKSMNRPIETFRTRWFADDSNSFDIREDPSANRRTLRDASIAWAYFTICLMLPAIWMSYNQFDRADGTVLTGDLRRVYLILNTAAGILLGSALAVGIFGACSILKARKSWWVVAYTDKELTMQSQGETKQIPWTSVQRNASSIVFNHAQLCDGGSVYWARSFSTRAVMKSRVRDPKPRLFTPVLVLLGLACLISGPFVEWVYRWLDVDFIDHGAILLSGLCLIFWSLVPLGHVMERRAFNRSQITE